MVAKKVKMKKNKSNVTQEEESSINAYGHCF